MRALVGGSWTGSDETTPRTWDLLESALALGLDTYRDLVSRSPNELARFLRAFAEQIEDDAGPLATLAEAETSLPAQTRFIEVEIPRTIDQLRQAAQACEQRTWREPTVDTARNVARLRQPIPGTVVVMGPNNFPFAFNAVGGGDFAAAVATGHPVLAKSNPGHHQTTRRLAELAQEAIRLVGLPAATLQLFFDLDVPDGLRLVADPRVAATAFTGSRTSGMALKEAADAAGRPIYLEMSSMNPVVVFPHALRRSGVEIGAQIAASIMNGSGQFCTKPGLVFVPESLAPALREGMSGAVETAPMTVPLLGVATYNRLATVVDLLRSRGARTTLESPGRMAELVFPTTVLEIDALEFIAHPDWYQEEAFGNATLLVMWDGLESLLGCVDALQGSLAASVYFEEGDESELSPVLTLLGERVGRIVANRPPTGVQVVEAMNHGGPFPATGHPGFTAVGIPESLKRFTMLQAFDGFPSHLLPAEVAQDDPLDLKRVELP